MHEESKSYPLPLQTMPSLEMCHHLTDLLAFRDFLEHRCIETKNTRIERYIEYLKQQVSTDCSPDPTRIFKTSTEGPFEAPIDWNLYILREVHELMWILKGLKVHVPLGLDTKLKTIVSGRDFAALDADSHSRNTQFELRIASYFCQAGYDVDLSTETDIIALSDSVAFYCECKRVGSANQLQKRLSDAKKQLCIRTPKKLRNRDIFSCVAADVTKVAFAHNGLTWGMTNEHSRDVIQNKLIAIAEGLQRLPLFQDCRHLLDYWLQIHIPALVIYPPTPSTRFSSFHIFKGGMDRKERRATKAFCSLFESASFQGDPREHQAKPLTLRTSITLPKGTSFGLRSDLIADFLESGKIDEKRKDDWVARIEINNKEHFFSIFDFIMVLPEFTEIFTDAAGFRKAIEQNPSGTRLELIMAMYRFRFPYVELGDDRGAEIHPITLTPTANG